MTYRAHMMRRLVKLIGDGCVILPFQVAQHDDFPTFDRQLIDGVEHSAQFFSLHKLTER